MRVEESLPRVDWVTRVAAAIFLALLATPAIAQSTWIWNPGNTFPTSSGTSGVWSTSAANWSNGTSNSAWSNSSLNVASFNRTSTTSPVTLGSDVTVENFSTSISSYVTISNIGGNNYALTFVGSSTTAQIATGGAASAFINFDVPVIFSTATRSSFTTSQQTLTNFRSGIASKDSNGNQADITLTIGGATTLSDSSTYSGTTVHNQNNRTLSLGNDYALGSSTLSLGNTTNNGLWNTLQSTGGLRTLANAIRFTTVGGSSTSTQGVRITGTTANGTNDFVLGGNVVLTAGGNAFLNVSTVKATFNGAFTEGSAFEAGIVKSGDGVLALMSSANAYRGKTTVTAGTLEFNSIGNVSGGNSALGAPTTVANGTIDLGLNTNVATLRYVGSGHSSNRTISITGSNGGVVDASGSGALDLTSGTITTAIANNSLTITGTNTGLNAIGLISGTGLSLTKSGVGTWRLSGANTYSGNTTVGNGILQFNSLAGGTNAQSLGGGTSVNLGVASTSSGEIDYYNATSGTLDKNVFALGNGRNRIRNSGGGTLTLSGTLTKDGTILELAGGTFNVTGRITGASANSDLFVNGASVTLTNTNNDYNGPTYVYGGGSLTLGASNVIPAGSSLILGGTGSDTGTGTINTGLFTDTIASLTTSSAGATVGISINGSTAGGLTTTGNITFGAGTDTLALALSGSLSLGRYQLLTYQGTRSGTFDAVTGLTDARYNVVYGNASNSSIDLQHKATIGTITATPASATIIVGGTTAFGFTVQNSAPSLAADLLATVSTGSNVLGSASLGAVAAGSTSSSVSGLAFTSNTVGLGQTGQFTLTDAAATNSPQQGSVTVNVLNHSRASFAATDMETKTLNFGTYDNGVWAGGDGGDGTLGYSIFNIASLGFTDAQTAALDLYDWVLTSGDGSAFSLGYSAFQNLASGSSNSFSASVLSPGSLVDGFYTATYTLKFRDQQDLSGAANTRDLTITLSANVIVVPEPGALALAGLGIAAVAWAYRRRGRR